MWPLVTTGELCDDPLASALQLLSACEDAPAAVAAAAPATCPRQSNKPTAAAFGPQPPVAADDESVVAIAGATDCENDAVPPEGAADAAPIAVAGVAAVALDPQSPLAAENEGVVAIAESPDFENNAVTPEDAAEAAPAADSAVAAAGGNAAGGNAGINTEPEAKTAVDAGATGDPDDAADNAVTADTNEVEDNAAEFAGMAEERAGSGEGTDTAPNTEASTSAAFDTLAPVVAEDKRVAAIAEDPDC